MNLESAVETRRTTLSLYPRTIEEYVTDEINRVKAFKYFETSLDKDTLINVYSWFGYWRMKRKLKSLGYKIREYGDGLVYVSW